MSNSWGGSPVYTAKRDVILAVACHLAGEIGLWNLNASRLAARMKIPRTTIIYHAGNNDQLRNEVARLVNNPVD